MFFVGDIAFPKEASNSLASKPICFDNASVIANLEGAILQEGADPSGTNLYNDRAVLPYLQEHNIRLVSLANNHITDVNNSPRATIDALLENGILTCGAGDTLDEASRATLLKDAEGEAVFMGFGWDVIGCRIASREGAGVNPLSQESVLHGVEKTKKVFPGKRIILLMHWDYELEVYPQPMHRQIAHMAIDHGASAVIGCHSHCVQGIEVYSGSPIVYGLGNWFLPEGQVFGRNLGFPDFALRQLAFEWVSSTGNMRCHWFLYDRRTKSVEFDSSETLRDSTYIATLTPFSGMSHADYINWFKKNRRKKILLPVYADSRSKFTNRLRDTWVKGRHTLLSIASAAHLKRGLR
jgi:Bacterial capsule synthesis protein PGA_cap